jgi:prophage regulatory protein
MTGNIKKKQGIVYVPYKDLHDHGIDYTRVHLNRLIELGQFPPPLQLSAHRVAWVESDLDRWKASRRRARIPGVKRRKAAQSTA